LNTTPNHEEPNFFWLVNTNLLAVFLLFFFAQLLNDRAFVARYNFQQALQPGSGEKKLDVNYLARLGPATWPVLQQVADNDLQFGNIAELAKEQLHIAASEERSRMQESDWRSWQYRRWAARDSLPGFEEGQNPRLSHSSDYSKEGTMDSRHKNTGYSRR